jgi:hypothetical protein
MVTVTGFDAAMYDTVVDILDDEGSIDLDARESEWRSSGWSGYQGAPRYADPGDISGTGGMAGATSGLAGTSAGLGTVIDPPDTARAGRSPRTATPAARSTTTGGRTARSDGAEMGRRSQADLGSQQVGTATGLGGRAWAARGAWDGDGRAA